MLTCRIIQSCSSTEGKDHRTLLGVLGRTIVAPPVVETNAKRHFAPNTNRQPANFALPSTSRSRETVFGASDVVQ